jgi:hypothetical protein
MATFCEKCGRAFTRGRTKPGEPEKLLHTVQTGGVAVMTCDCGSNLFMVYFHDGKIHINCEGCDQSFQVLMGAPRG